MSQTLFSPRSFSSVALNWIDSMWSECLSCCRCVEYHKSSVTDVQDEDTPIKQRVITFLRMLQFINLGGRIADFTHLLT